MIFQEMLAEHDARVLPLQKVLDDPNPARSLGDHWKFIMDEINYHPIFHVSRELLLDLTAAREIHAALKQLANTALKIVSNRAALRHDLMGRVYHRLLADAKYLGTYYTSIPAASLLLRIALRPDVWDLKWDSLDALRRFRIADLACGTGTLLMASADTITDNYVQASAEQGGNIEMSALQAALAEDILYGYDVLPSALHLTASTLALKAPDVVFTRMNLFSLPLGGPDRRLGSLELLGSEGVGLKLDLFGGQSSPHQVHTRAADQEAIAKPPAMDLCVMNPPFTRSVGGNLLFGSAPAEERREMREELKRRVKEAGALASVTAGLGSVFVAIADRYIKPGGRLGLILPKAVLSGVAWGKTRQLLRNKYRVEYIISSHDPSRWNFSESTSLSEVLLVAVKSSNGDSNGGQASTIGVNLWRNPTTSFNALAVASELLRSSPPDIQNGQGAAYLCLGEEKMGEAISIPWDQLKQHIGWLLPCAFAQSDLVRVATHLIQNRVWIPGCKGLTPIPLSPLNQFGKLGPDARDVHDAFSLTATRTAYPAFWGHDASEVTTLDQKPNRYLAPLPEAKEGRSLRKATDLWPLAGGLLLAERLRVNTQRLAAVRLPEPVLSSVWWSFSFFEQSKSADYGKALSLWLNSTLGLLLLLAHREETEGAWMKFKKPVLAALPVLDVGLLSNRQRKGLSSVYDRIANTPLQPFHHIGDDPVRAEIDQAIGEVLELPDLSVLRLLLGQEPVVCLKRL